LTIGLTPYCSYHIVSAQSPIKNLGFLGVFADFGAFGKDVPGAEFAAKMLVWACVWAMSLAFISRCIQPTTLYKAREAMAKQSAFDSP